MAYISLNISNGTKQWMKNNCVHNRHGPAIVWHSTDERWILDGLLHRIGGPAVTIAGFIQSWYFYGKCHRTDGPAIIRYDNTLSYYINDINYDTYLEYSVAIEQYKELG